MSYVDSGQSLSLLLPTVCTRGWISYGLIEQTLFFFLNKIIYTINNNKYIYNKFYFYLIDFLKKKKTIDSQYFVM